MGNRKPILVQPKPKKIALRTLRRREIMRNEGLSRKEYAEKYGSAPGCDDPRYA